MGFFEQQQKVRRETPISKVKSMVRARQIDIPEDSQETSNLSLVQDSAHRTMGGFPYVESIGKNNIGMICIINVLKESDLHFT